MKILYGIQGTGNGHLTRARLIAREFNEYPDVEVTYLFSGRPKHEYFDMEVFKGEILYKKGLTFTIDNGSVDIIDTIKDNDIYTFLKDIDTIDTDKYDLIISDYEPIVSWAAKFAGKECIGIGHQYAFNYDIPKTANWLVHFGMKWFAPASINIGLHWDSFNQPIFPPIIEQLTPLNQKDFVLVYLPNEELYSTVELLSKIDQQFVLYRKENYDGILPKNVKINKINKEGFINDLRSCKAVICNSGFELSSEAIHLGKKLLVKPVHNQIEQLANSKALVKLNYGVSVDELTRYNVNLFLQNDIATTNLPKFPDVAHDIVFWLIFRQYPLEKLSDIIWKKIK